MHLCIYNICACSWTTPNPKPLTLSPKCITVNKTYDGCLLHREFVFNGNSSCPVELRFLQLQVESLCSNLRGSPFDCNVQLRHGALKQTQQIPAYTRTYTPNNDNTP